ncbi:hypothetical protein KA012_02650 [Candidatus Woesebacteria bacterium]|nr:hypothetical protein [Candidatus Woesebacteria bacterium]
MVDNAEIITPSLGAAQQELLHDYQYETSFGLSRFVGVPLDNQLLEVSSSEGIFCGRTISDVYTSDSDELAQENIDWETASSVLTYLAVAAAYHEGEIARIIKELRDRVIGEQDYFDLAIEQRERYDQSVQEAICNMPDLPGFPGITARRTGAKF